MAKPPALSPPLEGRAYHLTALHPFRPPLHQTFWPLVLSDPSGPKALEPDSQVRARAQAQVHRLLDLGWSLERQWSEPYPLPSSYLPSIL